MTTPATSGRRTALPAAACALLMSLALSVPAARAADEIHWTFTGQTSVTVNWRGCESFVRYGPTPAYGRVVGGAAPNPMPQSNPGPFWEARITGLRENTVYHYAIGNGPDHTFRTPPRHGDSGFSVFAAGDVGDSGSYGQVAVLQDMIAAHSPDFVLMVGDLTYGNDNGQAVVGRHFNDVMRWSQDAAYIPAWGNHEWDAAPDDDLRNYKGRFDLPNPQTSPGVPPESCCGEDWSWFDYGNVRFIGYPEPYTPAAWDDWFPRAQVLMDEAQADPAITFIVVFGHRPAYSSGNHAGSPALKNYLDQLGATHPKFVLSIGAHSHNYERSHPQNGVVHITAGMGGAHLHALSGSCKWEGGCPPPAWSAFRALRHGAFKLRFTEGAIEGTLFCGPTDADRNDVECTPGDIVDTFTIGAPTPAATYIVDGGNPACSDAGPGTDAQPFCSIGAAVAAHAGPGVKLVVRPGTYPEQITLPASGAAGNPYTLAADPGVIVEGADDLSQPADWIFVEGAVWLAPGVTAAPRQVLVDGTRYTLAAAGPTALPAGEFHWTLGEGLYLNVGGDNPGLHQVFSGRRSYGFLLDGISYVTIEGFDVRHADDRAVQIQSGSSHVTLRRNTMSFSAGYGLQISQGSEFVVEDNLIADNANHGVSLVSGVTGSTLSGNESCRNARPASSGANGIHLHGSPGNQVIGNRVHHNQDSGIQVQTGSNDCTVSLNRSWSNGDHGFDQTASSGLVHTGNVAWGNQRSGFIIQGASTGSRITNCIATDNGLTQAQFNLSVDAASTAGFSSNANLFWNSNGQPGIKFGSLSPMTLAEYQAATGHDAGSLEADPRFLDPAAGDFHLCDGSPAIDSGDSGAPAWSELDAEGYGRNDALVVWDTGTGPVPYSDRGALEHLPGAPSPALSATPATGIAPLLVTLDGGASSATGGAPVSFEFDFGDGLLVMGQPSATISHIYPAGSWVATLWVADSVGTKAKISTPVVVAPAVDQNLASNPSFETNTSGWNSFSGGVLTRIPGGFDGQWALQVTTAPGDLTFGINDSPNLVSSTSAGARYRIGAWVSSSHATGQVTMRVQEFQGGTAVAPRVESTPVSLSCLWQVVTLDYTAQASGSNLDIQILDLAGASGEAFHLDHITAYQVQDVTAVPPDSLSWRPLAPVLAPNPVIGAGLLRFSTWRRGPLRVEIFDIAGRRVQTLIDEVDLAAGEHAIAIRSQRPGGRLSSGLYFYRIQANEGTVTRRFMLLR